MNYFVYDGHRSTDYNMYISGWDTFGTPSRDVETVTVAGRNGTLTLDNGRYNNIDIEYQAFIPSNFSINTEGIRALLMSAVSYRRLEDTYHPDEYRLARYIDGLSTESSVQNRAGKFTLKFDCRPERFLRSGEIPINISDGLSLYNPYDFEAKPFIRLFGNGTINIGDIALTVADSECEYVDVDCDLQDAYYGSINMNNNLTLDSGKFPTLKQGITKVNYTGFTKAIITPRWWIL